MSYVSIPNGSIKIGNRAGLAGDFHKFQFQMVRLKFFRKLLFLKLLMVSIPNGSIKIAAQLTQAHIFRGFNSKWFD